MVVEISINPFRNSTAARKTFEDHTWQMFWRADVASNISQCMKAVGFGHHQLWMQKPVGNLPKKA